MSKEKTAKAPKVSAAAQDRADILAALARVEAKVDALLNETADLRASQEATLAAAINAERAASL